MTPWQARLAACAFVLLTAAIAANLLLFQGPRVATSAIVPKPQTPTRAAAPVRATVPPVAHPDAHPAVKQPATKAKTKAKSPIHHKPRPKSSARAAAKPVASAK